VNDGAVLGMTMPRVTAIAENCSAIAENVTVTEVRFSDEFPS
jgi:hypothetical protein